jgi:hypothetical protein
MYLRAARFPCDGVGSEAASEPAPVERSLQRAPMRVGRNGPSKMNLCLVELLVALTPHARRALLLLLQALLRC